MKRLCLAFIGLIALAGAAAAADLGQPASPPNYSKAPAFVPPPPFSWTGLYFGINGGGAFGTSSWDSAGSRDVSGGLGGAMLGYNYQAGPAVFGAEADIDAGDIYGTGTTLCPAGCKTSNTWLSTVRGRLGYAGDRFMPYITGGAAFGNIRASAPGVAGASSTEAGWTLGAGLEAAFTGNWAARVEYLYVDLGSFNCGISCGAGLATDKVSFSTSVLRAGVTYKFW